MALESGEGTLNKSEADFFFSTDEARPRQYNPKCAKTKLLFATVTGLGTLTIEPGHFNSRLE